MNYASGSQPVVGIPQAVCEGFPGGRQKNSFFFFHKKPGLTAL